MWWTNTSCSGSLLLRWCGFRFLVASRQQLISSLGIRLVYDCRPLDKMIWFGFIGFIYLFLTVTVLAVSYLRVIQVKVEVILINKITQVKVFKYYNQTMHIKCIWCSTYHCLSHLNVFVCLCLGKVWTTTKNSVTLTLFWRIVTLRRLNQFYICTYPV